MGSSWRRRMGLPWRLTVTTNAPAGQRVTIDRCRFYERARSRWLRPVPDGLRRLVEHASASDALLRSGDALAAGATVVAAVVALRLAATSSTTEEEDAEKWSAIQSTTALLPAPVVVRLGRLCEAARGAEARRALAGDRPATSRGRTIDAAWADVGRSSGPFARGLYSDVLWFRGRPDAVSSLVADIDADARELDRRGLATAREGAEAYLCDVALALCVDVRTQSTDPGMRLLQSARLAARERPSVLAMIDAAIAANG